MVSNSTKGSAIGVPLAIILAWILEEFYKIKVPGEVGVAMGAALGLTLGFIGDLITHWREE